MNDYVPYTSSSPSRRRFARNAEEAWLGGVCSGVADYFRIDRNLVRLGMVIGTVLGLGSLVLVYIAAWILMPRS